MIKNLQKNRWMILILFAAFLSRMTVAFFTREHILIQPSLHDEAALQILSGDGEYQGGSILQPLVGELS